MKIDKFDVPDFILYTEENNRHIFFTFSYFLIGSIIIFAILEFPMDIIQVFLNLGLSALFTVWHMMYRYKNDQKWIKDR